MLLGLPLLLALATLYAWWFATTAKVRYLSEHWGSDAIARRVASVCKALGSLLRLEATIECDGETVLVYNFSESFSYAACPLHTCTGSGRTPSRRAAASSLAPAWGSDARNLVGGGDGSVYQAPG